MLGVLSEFVMLPVIQVQPTALSIGELSLQIVFW